MPCDSNITRTQIKDAARAREALKAVGLRVGQSSTDIYIATAEGLTLSRRTTSDAFIATGAVSQLAAVGRKYAELSTRVWAKAHGLNVRSSSDKGMVLVSQKGG